MKEKALISYHATIGEKTAWQSELAPTFLQQLPLGAIQCREGWLAYQLNLMTDGITGRLPEYGPFFRPQKDGFLNPDVKDGWEEVPYWLRGAYPLAVLTGDARLLALTEKYIRAILSSRDADGWFGPAYLKDYGKTEDGDPIPDLYPNMFLIDTLLLYHSRTADPAVLSMIGAYVRFCLRLKDSQFLPPQKGRLIWQKIRAGEMMEQLYRYYELTGDADALTLARRAYRSILPSICGYPSFHAVDFAHRFAYDAIYSRLSGSKRHFERTEYEYDRFKQTFGQMPRGIFAADEQIRVGATDPRDGYEPCGIVELAHKFYTLARISGNTIFADRAEDVMLNHFPASFTEDYRQVHYITAANRPAIPKAIHTGTFNGSRQNPGMSYEIFTPNNRCCGHNTGMGWPWYVMNLWQSTQDGGLAAMLYAPCALETERNGARFALRVETDYPFRGEVCIHIDTDGRLPLYFRLPAWNRGATCLLNGERLCDEMHDSGWLRVERGWQAGDTLRLQFAMEISLSNWKGNGSVSVDRGPLTYSVRIPEEYRVVEDAEAGAYAHPNPHLWENYEVLPKGTWNYGLCVEGDFSQTIRISHLSESLPFQPFTEQNAPIVLKARAKRIPSWGLQDELPARLQQSPIYSDEPEEEIEMIPLGCARLRMSCLPVITDDPQAARWQEMPEYTDPDEMEPEFPVKYAFGIKF